MAQADLESAFRRDLLQVVESAAADDVIWTDHPFLWLYERWREKGRSHAEVFDSLQNVTVRRDMPPEQRQQVDEGLRFLRWIYSGPHASGRFADLSPSERAVSQKILEGSYPTPTETKALPQRRLRFSVLVAEVRERVEGQAPAQSAAGPRCECGVVIEKKADGSYWTHRSVEIGVGRFSDPVRLSAPCLEDAVRLFLHDLWNSELKTLPIDWRA